MMPITARERKKLVQSRRGLQAEIARQLDISESHVSQVVRGKREGSERLMQAIADALALPIEDVFGSVRRAEETTLARAS